MFQLLFLKVKWLKNKEKQKKNTANAVKSEEFLFFTDVNLLENDVKAVFTHNTSTSFDNEWLLDTGATLHLTGFVDDLNDPVPCPKVIVTGAFGNSKSGNIKGSTSVNTSLPDGTTTIITINNVVYIPGLDKRIISFSRLEDKGASAIIKNGEFSILDCNNKLAFVAKRVNNLYFVCTPENKSF